MARFVAGTVVALALALSLSVAACGGGTSGTSTAGDEQDAANAAVAFFTAESNHDPQGMCAQMSTDLRNLIAGTGNCVALARTMIGTDVAMDEPKAAQVSISGDTGTVEITSSEGNTQEASMVKENGGWRVDDTKVTSTGGSSP